MKKSPYFQTSVVISKLSPKGFGVGFLRKTESSPLSKVLIPHAIPGDEVLADVGSKKQGAYAGKVLEIVKASSDRVGARCIHAGSCGGCSLQQMSYDKQLSYKENLIKELFASIFTGAVLPIIGCKDIWNYRNKMEYTFSQDKEGSKFLGLIIAGSKGRVESLAECHLCPLWFIDVLKAVRNWWDQSSLLAYNGYRDTGSLRTLTLREGRSTGQKMAILTVSGVPEFGLKKADIGSFALEVKKALPDCLEGDLSIFLRVQQSIAGQVTQFYEMQLAGPAHILEEIEISLDSFIKKYRFKISPTAFFQPNTAQAEKIYSKALSMVEEKKRKRVLDLYAGTATLGMIFASFAEKVISIEINPYAVFDAEMNKEINAVENLQIYKGDVAQVLKALRSQDSSWERPDLVLVDPPRTGLSFEALSLIVELKPEEILYISCSPSTQARDCILFKEAGYEIVKIQPIDQFPHTIHVENIALLRQK